MEVQGQLRYDRLHKKMNKQSNKTTNFILGLIFSLLLISGSIHSYIKEVDINLDNTKSLTGIVTYTDIRDIKKNTLRRRGKRQKRVFYFKLHNSDQNFMVHRSYEGYDDMEIAIKKVDTIKVYFRPSSQKYNDNVFQVEKGEKIIAHYYEYNKTASQKAGIGLFLGTALLVYMIMWFANFNLFKFLLGLVTVKRSV